MSIFAMIMVVTICLVSGSPHADSYIAGALVGLLLEVRELKETLEAKL